MKTILTFCTLILLTSCILTDNIFTDVTINKKLTINCKNSSITTKVEAYSHSKKWFYGTIKIYNKTLNTMLFNFNQPLIIDGIKLESNYNIFPISYAQEAFQIPSLTYKTWTVAWPIKNEITKPKDVNILIDTISTFRHEDFYKYIKTDSLK